MSIEITTPFPVFADVSGKPLEDGYIYIGLYGVDPVNNPQDCFWDSELTELASQPIRTKGGIPVKTAGVSGKLFIGGEYSITVKNKNSFVVSNKLTCGRSAGNGLDTFLGSKSILPPPTGLGWTPPFTVYQHPNGVYSTDFDIEDYRPVGTPVDVYVSPTGNDANSGLTELLPKKNLKTALALAESLTVSGDACRLILASGSYVGTDQIDPAGLIFTDRKWIVETLDGGSATIGIYSDYTWSKTGGQTNVYQVTTAHTFQSWVFDAGVLDEFGLFTRLAVKASVAEVDATQGSWFLDAGVLYVHTADSRVADNNLRMFADRVGLSVDGNGTLFIRNVTIHGGSTSAMQTQDTASHDPNLYAYNCEFAYSFDDGIDADGGDNIFLENCRCIRNAQDGFNYGPGLRTAIGKVIEINCTATNNGSSANNDQGSSIHYGFVAVSVNSQYIGAMGQGIADAEANRWCVGCTAGSTRYIDDQIKNRNASFSAFSLSKLWLDGCRAFGSIYDLLSQEDGELYYQNCFFTGDFYKIKNGIIEQYTNYSDVPFFSSRFVLTDQYPRWPDNSKVVNHWASRKATYDRAGRTVTYSGSGITWEPGPYGDTIVLPGTSPNYFYIDSTTANLNTNGAWIYWDGQLTVAATSVLAALLRTASSSLISLTTNTDHLQVGWTDSAGGLHNVELSYLELGTDRHSCAVAYYDGTISVYFDGRLMWQEHGTSLNGTTYGQLYSGRNSAGTDYYPMKVHSIAAGIGYLSPSDVLAMHNDTQTQILDDVRNAVSEGTTYDLTTTPAAIDFGTTDPSITIRRGAWEIRARVVLKYSGATFAANRDITLKLRRVNNTAADLASSTTVVTTDVVTTKTGTFLVVSLPETIYNTTGADIITIFASISALPSAGSMVVTEAQILAKKIN